MERNQRSNYQHLLDHQKSESSRKTSISVLFDYAKAFDCVHHHKLWKILRDENIRPPDLPLEKPVCGSEQQFELDMGQQTGSK